MKEYKYLFFDLDNTVFDFSKAEYLAIKETFKYLGIEVTEEEPLGIYFACDLIDVVADTFQLHKHL